MTEKDLNPLPVMNSGDAVEIRAMSSKICQPCSSYGRKSSAAIFCTTCNEYQCDECSNRHDIYSIIKTHVRVDANLATEKIAMLRGLDHCEKHGKRFEYFCADDDILCCSACAIYEHRCCNNLQDIEKLDTVADRLIHLKESILDEKEKCMTLSKHWAENERKVQDQVQKIHGTLAVLRTSIEKRIAGQKAGIIEELQIFETEIAALSERRLRCEMFILQHRFEESMNTDAEHLFSELENNDCSLDINEHLESLIETKNIGKVDIESVYKNHAMLEEKVSIPLLQNHDDTDFEEPLYTGMDFLPDGRLVAVDNYNNRCLIFDHDLLLLKSFE